MKKFWILPLLIISLASKSQQLLKPVKISVVTTYQKTVTRTLYAITDSTISLSLDSKIDHQQLQPGDNGLTGCSDSVIVLSSYVNNVLTATFSFNEIEKVKTPFPNSAIAGMLIGGLLGVRAGMWAGVALDANNTEGQSSSMSVAVGFCALNGAIIGALAMPHHKTYPVNMDRENFKELAEIFRTKYGRH